jgi:aspartyl-tRNA(Asn)/glutamyl-tRNA(Gln) amidotransferase subunit C
LKEQEQSTMSEPAQDQTRQITPLDDAAVDRICRLARLAPDTAEKTRLQAELGSIIGYFQRLEKLDTQAVEPAYHPHAAENQLRPDEVRPSEPRDELMALSARTKDGCLVVPRTVE